MTPVDKTSFWTQLKQTAIAQLKGAAVKAALIKILGSAAMGGFRAWLIKIVVSELFEHIAEPIIRAAFREGKFQFDTVKGEIQFKKIQRAKEEGNEADYNRNIDDI